jgi:membrane-associated phospholipid phosphatase
MAFMVGDMALPAQLAVALLLASSPEDQLAARDRPPENTVGAAVPPFQLRYHPFGDPAVAAFMAAAWASTELVSKSVLAPSACTLCDRDPDGVDRLNGLDRWGRGARWPGPDAQHTADTLSNIVGFGVLPVAIAGIDVALAHAAGAGRGAVEDLVLVTQTAASALLLNQAVKFIAGRERPFVHALTPDERSNVENPQDANLSFFSGHATFAFSAVVAAGTLAELRAYSRRALIWAVGLPLAAATGYLRIAADKHYLSDVLVGAAVGAAFGAGVPLLLHPREDRDGALQIRLLPSARGLSLSARF